MDRPALESERLRLVRLSAEDARIILAGGRPEGISFATLYPGPFSLEVMDLLAGERQSEAPGFESWLVTLRDSCEAIGDVGGSVQAEAQSYTVGYDIIEPMQNRGYATEALKTLIGHLQARPDIEVIVGDTFPDHTASRRVMEKAGMVYARDDRQVVDGHERDLVVYEMRRPDAT